MIYKSNSVENTYEIAKEIATKLIGGEVILLNGELGAGKTTFTKGLALALGVERSVTSPTFTIIKEYVGSKFELIHMDMYRLEDEDEVYELGVEEYLRKDTIVVIEWNKISKFPCKVIKINVTRTADEERIYEVEGL